MKHLKLFENFDQENLIEEIKNIVKEYGSVISTADLLGNASPVYKDGRDKMDNLTIDLVERLYPDSVEIISYGGYKFQTELDQYEVPYEELSKSTLLEIKELLDDAIIHNYIEKDI